MAEIDLTPTEEMAANAARGLELRRKHGKGGTEIGVARARDISNRKNLSPETVRRMHAFFSRHEKNKAGGEDDAGYIAWLLWGGDSGRSWAKRKVEQMDKGENQRSDTYKEIAQRLGSAAKFAITKEQIRGASREELRSIEQRLQALAKSGDKNAAALLDYVEEEYNDRYRGTHSRPGAKAKMGKDRPLDVTKTSGSSGGTWRKVMTSYGSKKAAVLTFIDNGQVGQVYQDPDNPSVYKAFDMDGTLLGQGSESEMKRRVEARNFARLGSRVVNARTKYVVMLKSQRTGNTIKFPVTAINEAEAKNYANAVYGDAWKVMSVSVENSRPGAKAKMQKEYVLWGIPKGKTSALDEQVLSTQAKTPAQMDAIKKRAAADGWHSFRVQILDLSKPYKGFGFSRPGAKAKFAADAREVGNEILRQLGGGRFMSMVGGKNAMYGTFGGKPGLQVSIGKGAEGGINRVIVTLDPATDTYRMEFWKIAKGGMSTQKVSEASMVYADDLQRVFTDRTRFYTSLSRPGEKTKMQNASWMQHVSNMLRDLTNERQRVQVWIAGPTTVKVAGMWMAYNRYGKGAAIASRMAYYLTQAAGTPGKYSGQDIKDSPRKGTNTTIWTVSNVPEDAVSYLKAWGIGTSPKAFAGFTGESSVAYTRPGAKAKFGMTNAGYKALVDAIRVYGDSAPAAVVAQAKQMKQEPTEFTDNEVMAVIDKMKQSRASRPGAKVANAVREGEKVSASDDAVSRKIRKLMDEGKPQKQAVAIALDLERRGEL